MAALPAVAVRAPAVPEDEKALAGAPRSPAPGTSDLLFSPNLDRAPAASAPSAFVSAAGLPFRSVAYPAGFQPRTVTAADLDADGHPDLIVPDNGSTGTWIFFGESDGIYDGRPAMVLSGGAGNAQKAVAADFNGDGRLDIAVVHYFDGVYVWYQRADGSFGSYGYWDEHLPVGGNYSRCLATGDLNADGVPDIAVVSETGVVSVWTGPGPGGIWLNGGVYSTSANVSDWVELADLDGDGALDYIATNDDPSNSVSVARGNPAHAYPFFGSPAVYPVGSGPNTCTVTDLNGDGHADIAIASWNVQPFGGSVSVLLGHGDGAFGAAITSHYNNQQQEDSFAIGAGEFTGDSHVDVVIANGASGTLTLLPGAGDGTFGSPRLFGVGSAARGIALTDVNGDGRLDVAVSNLNSRTVEVLNASASGPFDGAVYRIGLATPSTFDINDRLIGALAAGDLNGDGHVDLATNHPAAGTVSVILGAGDGSYGAPAEFDAGPNPQAVVTADLDGDGRQDLAAANRDNGTVSVLFGNRDGTFQPRSSYGVGKGPVDLIAADVNGDGLVDLVTANQDESTISVLIKNKGGGFKDRVKYDVAAFPNGLAVGDVNGDGRSDIVVACLSGYVSVLTQAANGKLSASVTTYVYWPASHVVVADLDRDGRLDLAISSGTNDLVSIWRGTAFGLSFQGSFPTYGAPGRLVAGDLDGDGWPEVLGAARLGQTFVLYPYAPTGPHGTSRNWSFGACGTDVAMADANEDGKQDLITLHPRSQSVSVLVNAGGSAASMAARASGAAGSGTLSPVSISPNPLNPTATLRFMTAAPGPIRVRLYDVHGRLVRTLADERAVSPGEQRIPVDGRDDAGSRLASGVYYYRIETAGSQREGRLSVMK